MERKLLWKKAVVEQVTLFAGKKGVQSVGILKMKKRNGTSR